MLQPTRLISTPFAQEGEKTEIQNVTGEFDNSATYRLGFPPITMQSVRLGGKPPKGTDFNGVLFDITENISFLCKGGRYQYNVGLSTLIGGYPEGSNLLLDDNVTEVVSTVAGNQNNPNTDMTGWTFKPNRTTAVNVADASGETQQQVNYNGGSKWHSRVGGYQENERVVLANGDIVKSTVDGNVNDPNVDMTGWEALPNRSEIEKLNKATDFYVTPQMFAPEGVDIGDGVVDAYPYIKAALDTKFPVKLPFPSAKYRVTQNIVLQGHYIEGMAAAPELYGNVDTAKVIIEFDGVSGDAVRNKDALSNVKNIWFRQKDWSTQLNGLYLTRYAYFDDCMFTDFNGFGYYANANITENYLNPFHSVFNRCQFLRNAKHGVGIYNGANAITFRDCMSRWNGAPSYEVPPTSVGVWDGIYLDGYNPDFPPATTKMEPQGILIVGGDHSYNSRYGVNFHKAFDSTLIGGYIEANKVADLRVGASYSIQVLNPLVQTVPVLETVQQDPDTPSLNLAIYPNNIIVRGRNYGDGLKPAADATGYNQSLPSFYTAGSGARARMYGSTSGSMEFMSDSNQNINFQNSAAVNIKKFRLGNFSTTASNADNYIAAKDTVEGSVFYYMVNSGAYGAFRVANGGGANAADAFMSAPKNSVTLRSINAGGTINANGADYAEYMYKSDDCGDIAKGEIVGVDSNGKLTKVYDDAISFVVKSTDPSIVGGDVWFNESFDELEPVYAFDEILADDADDNEVKDFNARHTTYVKKLELDVLDYRERLQAFKERLELARQSVDRIAFCGQVPIIYNASVGDYIIPSRKSDGTIGIETTKTPTFKQHLKCVGKVWKIVDNISHIVIFNN